MFHLQCHIAYARAHATMPKRFFFLYIHTYLNLLAGLLYSLFNLFWSNFLVNSVVFDWLVYAAAATATFSFRDYYYLFYFFAAYIQREKSA